MQCALSGLSHLLQAALHELDESADFITIQGDILPYENKKKRKSHVLDSTTITTITVSKSANRTRVRYDDSMDEDEERDEGHEGESSTCSDDELVYEPPRNKRPRLDDIESKSATSTTSNGSTDDVDDDLVVPAEFTTLPPSKNPCLDALAFCVVMGYGAEQTEEDMRQSTISIYDCQKLLAYIKTFCPKQTQTNNDEYRVKALKRWFTDMPTKKMRTNGNSFVIKMKADRRRIIQRVIRRMQSYVKAIKLE